MPEIANSEEVQEFLALNTDARIAFVKKPFVVSRIDKVRKWGAAYLSPFQLPPEMLPRLQHLLGAKTLSLELGSACPETHKATEGQSLC